MLLNYTDLPLWRLIWLLPLWALDRVYKTPGELAGDGWYIISHLFYHGKGRKTIWIFSPYTPCLHHLCTQYPTECCFILRNSLHSVRCKTTGCSPYAAILIKQRNGLLMTQIHHELGTNILWGWVLFYRRWFFSEVVTNIWCYFSAWPVYEHRWTKKYKWEWCFSLQTLKTHLQNFWFPTLRFYALFTLASNTSTRMTKVTLN